LKALFCRYQYRYSDVAITSVVTTDLPEQAEGAWPALDETGVDEDRLSVAKIFAFAKLPQRKQWWGACPVDATMWLFFPRYYAY